MNKGNIQPDNTMPMSFVLLSGVLTGIVSSLVIVKILYT